MTAGQERAVRELERLKIVSEGAFDFSLRSEPVAGNLVANLSLRLGLMETRPGGLEFQECEEFELFVPSDFPFERPNVCVTHERFAGFPHVIWKYHLCLYQSTLEWNPADGLFGFFERFLLWLRQAAKNDMDPIEGPLEPPHHNTDFSYATFVIRANVPVPPGKSWLGLAELAKYENRIEVLGWHDSFDGLENGRSMALAIVFPEALPMEFPSTGADFFKELEKQGFHRHLLIRHLGLAALLAPEGEPVYLLIGLPMRRAADASPRLHIAVWAADAESASSLRHVIGDQNDTVRLKELREEMARLLYETFCLKKVRWCQVLENRPEIVVRRDAESSLAGFLNKRVLVLGCGALGSWTAEMIVRAGAASIDVVDSGVVKPGLLARQNFITNDIGNSKAAALAARLRQLVPVTVRVDGHASDAHRFVLEDKERFAAYDVVLDCTASHVMQMKLERDWSKFAGNTPPLVAMVTDNRSRRGICVCLARNSTGGQWDAFVRLKNQLCSQGFPCDFLSAFYDPAAAKELFQPEPGCSDPTFAGSTADAMGIAGAALNAGALHTLINSRSAAVAFTLHSGTKPTMHVLSIDDMDEVQAASYRVRISKKVHTEARGWVRQNNRLRTSAHETGGLLWGIWDDAVRVIWAFDVSGPPPDSIHDPGHFVCGTQGTREEHEKRLAISQGTSGFIGFWHTHPDMESFQSGRDIRGMAELVSMLGQNQKRSLMLIYGRKENQPTAGVYAYESHSLMESGDLVVAGTGQLILPKTVV